MERYGSWQKQGRCPVLIIAELKYRQDNVYVVKYPDCTFPQSSSLT